MGNLINAMILFSTVVMSVFFGVGAAYALVVGVLQAFGTNRRPTSAPQKLPVMIARESQASGD